MRDRDTGRLYAATALLALAAASAGAYEPSLINLETPSWLESPQLEIGFEHRFGRPIGAPSYGGSWLGGATISMDVRAEVWKGFGAILNYATTDNELDLALRYSHFFERAWLHVAGDVSFFTYQKSTWGDFRATNAAYTVSVQNKPLFDRVVLTAAADYDGYNNHVGLGTGLLVKLWDFLDVEGEYFPVIRQADNPNVGDRGVFGAGLKLNTGGHQFKIMVANATSIGNRRAMLGTDKNDVYVGFSIQRRFKL